MMSIRSLADFNGAPLGGAVTGWHRHRHRPGPTLRVDTTKERWGLLPGHQRGPTPGHQRGLSHGHGHGRHMPSAAGARPGADEERDLEATGSRAARDRLIPPAARAEYVGHGLLSRAGASELADSTTRGQAAQRSP